MAVSSGRSASVYWLNTNTPTAEATAKTTTAGTVVAVVANRIYRIATAQGDKRFIDPDSAITVTANSVSKTKGVDFDVVGPCIVFRADAVEPISISNYSYFGTVAGPDAREWSLDVTLDLEDSNTFFPVGDPDLGWSFSVPLLQDAKVTIGKWFNDGHIFDNHIGKIFVLALFTNITNTTTRAGERFECYAYNSDIGLKCDANGIPTEDLTFNVNGRVFYIAA